MRSLGYGLRKLWQREEVKEISNVGGGTGQYQSVRTKYKVLLKLNTAGKGHIVNENTDNSDL